jgi:S1-C subfamily serine protease
MLRPYVHELIAGPFAAFKRFRHQAFRLKPKDILCYVIAMKVLVYLLAAVFAVSGFSTEKPTSVIWEGKKIEDITDVHLNPAGRIVVIFSTSGFSTTEDKLPAEFLRAWGITEEQLQKAKTARIKTVEDDFERALRSGLFREVDGIVYDLRKTQSDWVQFPKAKVLQVLEDGAILNCTPDQPQVSAIFVRNVPKTIGDTDTISLIAKLTGSYSFVNKLGDDRTIRAYDLGRACTRDEIPDAITKEKKLWGKALFDGKATRSVLSQLPDNEEITSNGTGFFITTNGYLLSNWHVVRNAKKVKIKNRQGILPAEIIATDRDKDLALLKADGGPFKPLPISGEESVSLGESAFTIGFPNVLVQGLEPKYTDGKISSLSGLHDDPGQYQISVPVQPGNSGGPLMRHNGQVIGIIDAKMNDFRYLVTSGSLPQNVNYAIKVNIIRDFLRKKPEIKVPGATVALTPEAAVKSTEDAVVMILVY